MARSVQQLPQKLDVSSFLTLGENILQASWRLRPTGTASRCGTSRCLIMLSPIPRRLSSDVLLAAEAGSEESICQALAIVHAQGIGHLEMCFVLSKITQVSAKTSPYSTRNISVCSRPVENAAHSAPRELLTTRRMLREFHPSTEILWRTHRAECSDVPP